MIASFPGAAYRGFPGAAGRYVSGRTEEDAEARARPQRHVRTGRPLVAPALLDRLESLLGRTLRPHNPGPKPQGGKR